LRVRYLAVFYNCALSVCAALLGCFYSIVLTLKIMPLAIEWLFRAMYSFRLYRPHRA